MRGCGQKGHPSVLLQSPASSSLLAALQSSSFSSSLGLHLGKKREQARNYPTLLWYSTGCSCLQLWSCQMRTLKRTKMHSTLPDNTHGFSPVCLLTFFFPVSWLKQSNIIVILAYSTHHSHRCKHVFVTSAVIQWSSKRKMISRVFHYNSTGALDCAFWYLEWEYWAQACVSILFPKKFCWCILSFWDQRVSIPENLYLDECFSLDIWEEKAKPFRLMHSINVFSLKTGKCNIYHTRLEEHFAISTKHAGLYLQFCLSSIWQWP